MNENKISSGDEVQIDYLGHSSTLKKASSYNEFISSLVKKFYLTENMKEGMHFYYLDEDDEYVLLSSNIYDEFLKEAKKAVLKVEEKAESENKSNENGAGANSPEDLKSIVEQVNEYKNKLNEICQKNIEDRLEEVNKRHQKELKQLVELYEDKLKTYKNHIKTKTEELFKELKGKSIDILLDKLNEYNEDIEKEVEQLIKDKENTVINKVNDLDIGNLEKQQKEVSEIVLENKRLLQD